MKILAGELHETVFNAPGKGTESRPLTVKSSEVFQMNEVTYISDDVGLHRVHNPSPNRIAVSLHCESSNTSIATIFFLTQTSVYSA